MKPKWKWLPPWKMPSDPVKAVFWFLRWFLQVVVRYFFVLIIVGVAYEIYQNNGIVGALFTILIGLVVWGSLAIVLVVVNFLASLSQVYSQVSHLSQNPFGTFNASGPANSPYIRRDRAEENVVEGSIITDLDEERRKRRQEM